VDGRDEPGHDGRREPKPRSSQQAERDFAVRLFAWVPPRRIS
jgi:hypothetical protein